MQKKKVPISLDTETLSLDPHAAIIDIGAVNLITDHKLHCRLNPNWYLDRPNFVIDKATVKWHDDKNPGYLDWLCNIGVSGGCALTMLAGWLQDQYEQGEELHIWCKGKDADIPWLNNFFAYAAAAPIKPPYDYRNTHCLRDIAQLYPEVKPGHFGNHTALADAIAQGEHLRDLAAHSNRVFAMIYGERSHDTSDN